MTVQSDFQIDQFVIYMNMNSLFNKIEIRDKKGDLYITKIGKYEYKIHEDALPIIRLKCQRVIVENRISQ